MLIIQTVLFRVHTEKGTLVLMDSPWANTSILANTILSEMVPSVLRNISFPLCHSSFTSSILSFITQPSSLVSLPCINLIARNVMLIDFLQRIIIASGNQTYHSSSAVTKEELSFSGRR